MSKKIIIWGFLIITSLRAHNTANVNPAVQVPKVCLTDSERMTLSAVTFSKNMSKLPKEFREHVIATAPESLKTKMRVLLNAKQEEDISRRIILHGVPGSGKTTLALVIVQQLEEKGIPYLYLKAPAILNEYRNSGNAGIIRIAEMAVTLKGTVFIDELDCFTTKRNASSSDAADSFNTAKALGLLMDTLKANKIAFVGATNSIKDMPESLQSRMKGALFEVSPQSNFAEKLKIIKECLKDKSVDGPNTITLLAKLIGNASNRDIDHIVKLANENALARDSQIITYRDFKDALETIKKDSKLLKENSAGWNIAENIGKVANAAYVLSLTCKAVKAVSEKIDTQQVLQKAAEFLQRRDFLKIAHEAARRNLNFF